MTIVDKEMKYFYIGIIIVFRQASDIVESIL